MRAWSPTVMAPMSLAPAPTWTLLPSVGWRFSCRVLVPPRVTPWVRWQSSPIIGGLADDDAHAVVDEQPFADLAPGWISMPVQERLKWATRRGQDGHAGVVQRVGQAVQLPGVEARVEQDDLDGAVGRRVAVQRGLDVSLNASE